MSSYLEPFLPFLTPEIRRILQLETVDWRYTPVPAGLRIGKTDILFERIDKKKIEEETEKLRK